MSIIPPRASHVAVRSPLSGRALARTREPVSPTTTTSSSFEARRASASVPHATGTPDAARPPPAVASSEPLRASIAAFDFGHHGPVWSQGEFPKLFRTLASSATSLEVSEVEAAQQMPRIRALVEQALLRTAARMTVPVIEDGVYRMVRLREAVLEAVDGVAPGKHRRSLRAFANRCRRRRPTQRGSREP